MPALITHDFFGRDVYDNSFNFIGGSRDEADAFLLGNQGPDPLFYSVLRPSLHEHFRLGNIMHDQKPSELLVAFKKSLSILESEEAAIGRAYAMGFLCHYTLDSTIHPLVFFNEYLACDAGVSGLTRADGSEVHATIESELDELVLFTKRETTVASFNPAREILHASPRVLRVISKMYMYVALTVYNQIIPQDMFEISVQNFRLAQAAFYSPSGLKRTLVAHIERLGRNHSFFRAMSHRPIALTESIFDNHEHASWENPFTGEMSTKSFWDLYDEARTKAHANILAFDRPGFALEDAQQITHDLNFSGEPVVAVVVSVENEDEAARGVHAADATRTTYTAAPLNEQDESSCLK